MALAAGHAVTVFIRNTATLPKHSALNTAGELSDYVAVSAAFEGADAVLSTLGAQTNTADQVAAFASRWRTSPAP